MIVTITLNPSVDFLYFLDHFLKEGEHNRVSNPIKMIGGKGINASRVLSTLQSNFAAITIGGGSYLSFLNAQLAKDNIPVHIIPTQDEIRTAMTFMANGTHTELVEKGPKVDQTIIQKVLQTLENLNTQEKLDIISINGSIVSDNEHIYAELIDTLYRIYGSDIKVILDASQIQLKNALKAKQAPYFIKPNTKELSELSHQLINTKDDVIAYLKAGHFSHIPFVLVSMGEDGGIAQFNGQFYDITIPKIELVNPTGSGDSTVAGICHGLSQQLPIQDILKLAMACGMSNAMNKGIGVIDLDIVQSLIPQITVSALS
ncbi:MULTISPECIES: 1-phosphofructokinase family hexose kinase [unclassified Granulicatella]|uniref:1-phosphofructokinase family hexose kinase n=1 Tax=unclassified Granulicatella TaxID=2630493 RepID=UPI001073A4DE|nr:MULTISPECIES: 1-phosphofructokinase family hexose kinase [unclassified Granulicatella]MBF0779572.1 1-phosphofructokinase family hexose kinase [Granulicatella sp. 19428wC4_WM01]TFU96376.1 1-phosphofructokinase family hexose kinase [Granulicatella sp. WM01]